jgi:O-6-methylguanine DNA methyltransferase
MIHVCNKKIGAVWYSAAVQDNQVLATTFSFEEPDLKNMLRRLPQGVPFQVLEKPTQFLADVLGTLDNIFNGKGEQPYNFQINMGSLSSHTQKVLDCTRMVPVGYVTTYGAVAKVAGGCARSVGHVEASNPVPLLIPCHRVVRSDLSAGGYGYGGQVKRQILQKEQRGYEESKKLKVGNGELALFPAEWIKSGQGELLRA